MNTLSCLSSQPQPPEISLSHSLQKLSENTCRPHAGELEESRFKQTPSTDPGLGETCTVTITPRRPHWLPYT